MFQMRRRARRRIGLTERGAGLPRPWPIVLGIGIERELWRRVPRLRGRGDLSCRAEVAFSLREPRRSRPSATPRFACMACCKAVSWLAGSRSSVAPTSRMRLPFWFCRRVLRRRSKSGQVSLELAGWLIWQCSGGNGSAVYSSVCWPLRRVKAGADSSGMRGASEMPSVAANCPSSRSAPHGTACNTCSESGPRRTSGVGVGVAVCAGCGWRSSPQARTASSGGSMASGRQRCRANRRGAGSAFFMARSVAGGVAPVNRRISTTACRPSATTTDTGWKTHVHLRSTLSMSRVAQRHGNPCCLALPSLSREEPCLWVPASPPCPTCPTLIDRRSARAT